MSENVAIRPTTSTEQPIGRQAEWLLRRTSRIDIALLERPESLVFLTEPALVSYAPTRTSQVTPQRRRWTDLDAAGAADFFAEQLRDVEAVEGAWWSLRDHVVQVWTLIAGPDEAIQQRIYAAELDTMDTYGRLLFNWSVVFRNLRPLNTMEPPNTIRLR